MMSASHTVAVIATTTTATTMNTIINTINITTTTSNRNLTTPRRQQKHLLPLTIGLWFCLCSLIGTTEAVPLTNTHHMAARFEYKHYCSTTLTEAIRLICGGRYNSLARNFPDSFGAVSHRRQQQQLHYQQQFQLQQLLSGSHLVAKRSAPRDFNDDEVDDVFYRPKQSGPIHECCQRPCGYSDLRKYCAPEDNTTTPMATPAAAT